MKRRLVGGLAVGSLLGLSILGSVLAANTTENCQSQDSHMDCILRVSDVTSDPINQNTLDLVVTWLPTIIQLQAVQQDRDGDSIPDEQDNCPDIANPDQLNSDQDILGNACDIDDDNDGLSDTTELAQNTNPLLADTDADGVDDQQDEFPLDASKALSYANAFRLLLQTSFGPVQADIQTVMRRGAMGWVDEQLAKPSAYDSADDAHQSHLERSIQIALMAEPNTDWNENAVFNQAVGDKSMDEYHMATWWENTLGHPSYTAHGSDQLRQRIAYALSQILVVSKYEPAFNYHGEGLAFYYDILARNAFGNYRTLLDEVARSPAMGVYLSHQGNRKADPILATRPDENFARELIQLFTIGLYELNLDGSPNRDANPNTYPDVGDGLVPTYTQTDVSEMAKVMTGWDLVANTKYGKTGRTKGDYTTFMEFTPEQHEDETAENGDGQVTIMGKTFALNAGTDNSGLDAALDVLFQHPNMGPFISRHLIMRLVTSNPSSAYIARVATVFNNNGQGVRGDLKSVVRAILLDEEARDASKVQDPIFGKGKEPLLMYTQLLRALRVRPLDGWLNEDGVTRVDGVYWDRDPDKYIGQAALRAPSVFNFYDVDFVPSDEYFAEHGLVTPELQIQTDQTLIDISNRLDNLLTGYEKNRIERILNKTIRVYGESRTYKSRHVFLFDFDRELEIYEQALGGDFANMELINPATGIRYKVQAVDALLEHLDQLLLGGEMATAYRAALKHYLLEGHGSKSTDDFKEAWNNIYDAVRLIVTSSEFMVQK